MDRKWMGIRTRACVASLAIVGLVIALSMGIGVKERVLAQAPSSTATEATSYAKSLS